MAAPVRTTDGTPLRFNREWRFLIGIGFALALQITQGGFPGDRWGTGWWLDDGRRVAVGFLGTMALAFVTATSLQNANALWLGVNIGMAGVMFLWLGAGNLWPIVLAFAAGVTGTAIYSAWGVRFSVATVLARIRRGGTA